MEENSLNEAASQIVSAAGLVAFTGAGISEESGISPFRGGGGLWDCYPPERFGNMAGLLAEFLIRPQKLTAFLQEILHSCLNARPNPAHLVLAEWEAQGILRAVVTQNIDTLHERAGCSKTIKLHGSIDRLRCTDCGFKQDLDQTQIRRWARDLSPKGMGRRQLWRTLQNIFSPCPYAAGGGGPMWSFSVTFCPRMPGWRPRRKFPPVLSYWSSAPPAWSIRPLTFHSWRRNQAPSWSRSIEIPRTSHLSPISSSKERQAKSCRSWPDR